MAYNFENSRTNAFGSPAGSAGMEAKVGPDLEDIQTEGLAFRALHGETKVQLLETPWPADALPPPTASLLSISSQRGLLAAAGPDSVIGATTKSLRKALEDPNTTGSNLVPFQPQLRLPMPTRISHLAFSSEGKFLVLSAETGGGLAVYEVDALLQGSTKPSFQLATNGKSLRMLLPNPAPEKAELFAAVTSNGDLLVANLQEKFLCTGSNDQVLTHGVSCVAWSTKGKQLIAGLGDGTCQQLTPEGVQKGDIPRPPCVAPDDHVSSITWLENNVFLLVHTPSHFDEKKAPQSMFHIATRYPEVKEILFQKIPDPTAPFGLNRSPPHHFVLRLRDYPPNLQDLLILASTASTDVGVFSRSQVPLSTDKPADKITGVFTMTEMSDDSGRAQLPLSSDSCDTSPIGLALDLSSKENVLRPIPGDEMDETATPLPALMILNNEGVLASWWIIYTDSVRQKLGYPGLTTASVSSQRVGLPPQQPTPIPTFGGVSSQPSFGSAGFPKASATGVFPTSSTVPAIGSLSLPMKTSTGAFGAPSSLGAKPSMWGTPSSSNQPHQKGGTFGVSTLDTATPQSRMSAFGTSAFGQPAFGASSFGATVNPSTGSNVLLGGNGSSPWSSPKSTPAFGQPSGLGKSLPIFGSQGTKLAPPSGGFASFAMKGGFPVAAADASKPTKSIFNAQASTKSLAALQPEQDHELTLSKASNNQKNLIPSISGESQSFVSEKTEGMTSKKDSSVTGSISAVTTRADIFHSAHVPSDISNAADMDNGLKTDLQARKESTTPMTSPASQRSLAVDLSQLTTAITFADHDKVPSSSPEIISNHTAGSLIHSVTEKFMPTVHGVSTQSTTLRGPLDTLFQTTESSWNILPIPERPLGSSNKPAPRVSRVDGMKLSPQSPILPDTTSTSTFAANESSTSYVEAGLPLPPDFLPTSSEKARDFAEGLPMPRSLKIQESLMSSPSKAESPSATDDGTESDLGTEEESRHIAEPSDESSGEDAAAGLTSTSRTNHNSKFLIRNSHRDPSSRNMDSSSSEKTLQPAIRVETRALFGEINRSAPVIPPPMIHLSPRSPSPTRKVIHDRLIRPDASRSVSAPGTASALLALHNQQDTTTKSRTSESSIDSPKVREERQASERARRGSEEQQGLVDSDEARIQEFLSSEVHGTRNIDEFVAHSDYVSSSTMNSIPAQVEIVYRDMNSMIDTLGINERALKSFIKGHTEQYKQQERTREDLEDEHNWVLIEIEDLSEVIGRDLDGKMQSGRLKDVGSKLEICNNLYRDLTRLRARCDDLKEAMGNQSDSTHSAIAHGRLLDAEQLAQQHDMRKDYITFQALLAEVEEAFTMLKANFISRAASEGKLASSAGPTVETVLRTIKKMTGMAEKRSGDIDVLESKMRKLNLILSDGSTSSSPFVATQKGNSTLHSVTESQYDLKIKARAFRSSLVSSMGSAYGASPPRKRLSGYTANEKDQLSTKLARRKAVTGKLVAALEKTGSRVMLMED